MKFDLHIHSIASKYKESSGIVDKSTVENIGTLFKKLEENDYYRIRFKIIKIKIFF